MSYANTFMLVADFAYQQCEMNAISLTDGADTDATGRFDSISHILISSVDCNDSMAIGASI